MSRTQLYVGVSALLANLVLIRAYYERPNFYSAAVYVSQSNGSLMLLVNLALIVAVSFFYGLQRLLYGPLRAIETEQLYDKAWFAVSETLLAMTIFRDDVGVWFFAMFLLLLGGKVWQWIGEGRVEFLEQQPPANPRLFHTRLSSSLLLSVLFDAFMVNYCVDTVLREVRPGMMVMFGFEYALLFIVSLSTLCRYALSAVELVVVHRQTKARAEMRRLFREELRLQNQSSEGTNVEAAAEPEEEDDEDVPGWEEKGRWVFYLDLLTDFIKSVVYMGFFMILVAFHGIPIHIMRDLFMTLRSFIKRINDFVQYRNATRDMNARYPDATEEDLARDNTCIVCREEMRPWVQPGAEGANGLARRVDERQRAKKLPCGHILHFSCLRSWLERQQVCPTCRRPVLAENATQNNPPNNPANAGQPNQPAPNNQMNPQPGQLGQQQPQGAQGAQPNRPAGNLRVFNFGPFRLALGNVRLPANNFNRNNNAAIADFAQQIAQPPNQAHPALQPTPTVPGTLVGPSTARTPAEIQADIFRIQQSILHSMRQLHIQNAHLASLQALLNELQRLQQASQALSNGSQSMTLNPAGLSALPQQSYYTGQGTDVMRAGDPNLPPGVTLPEGWTLRRLSPVASGAPFPPLPHGFDHGHLPLAPPLGPIPPLMAAPPSFPPPPTNGSTTSRTPPSRTFTPESSAQSQFLSSTQGSVIPQPPSASEAPPQASNFPSTTQNEGSSSTQVPAPVGLSGSAGGSTESASKAAHPIPSSVGWGFGNVGDSNDAGEGSSSSISRGGEGSTRAVRRSATVEDADEE